MRQRPVAQERFWKVGELAERTGLTVRALHHYDAVGLLRPSGRTDAVHGPGHRLYTAGDLARLQQLLALRQLGFGLEEIRAYLARSDYDPRQVVRMHLTRTRQKAAELTQLADRLEALADALERAETVSPEVFLETIEQMIMIDKYYTHKQREQIQARAEVVGAERIRQVEQEWPVLLSEVQATIAAGVSPTDPKAQELARRWFGLVTEFTGGDPGLFQSLKRMYQNEDQIHGMDVAAMRPMMDYIGQAAAAAGIALPDA